MCFEPFAVGGQLCQLPCPSCQPAGGQRLESPCPIESRGLHLVHGVILVAASVPGIPAPRRPRTGDRSRLCSQLCSLLRPTALVLRWNAAFPRSTYPEKRVQSIMQIRAPREERQWEYGSVRVPQAHTRGGGCGGRRGHEATQPGGSLRWRGGGVEKIQTPAERLRRVDGSSSLRRQSGQCPI